MSLLQISQRYAQALFEVAQESQKLAEVQADMQILSRIFRELPEVLEWCQPGKTHHEPAETFVATAFAPYVTVLTKAILNQAAHHNRLALIPFLPEAFRLISDRVSETTRVTLETSQEPSQELLDQVADQMSKRTGKHAVVTYQVCPELVGGFRVLWNNRIIDMSARGRIRQMRALMTSV